MNKYLIRFMMLALTVMHISIYGMNPTAQEKELDPLYNTMRDGTPDDLAKILKEKTFNLEYNGSGYTPLTYAIMLSNGKMVQLLLQAGAKLDTNDKHRNTPLTYAAVKSQSFKGTHKEGKELDPFDVLLDAGADPNMPPKWENPPLFAALKGGYVPHIQKLIEAGANLDAKSTDGKDVVQYSLDMVSKYNPYTYIAAIFTVTPTEMESLIGSMIALTKRKVIGTKDAGILVINKLYDALLEDKIALAKKYNPNVTPEQLEAGKKMLRESFNRSLKKPLIAKQLKAASIDMPDVPG